MKFINQFTLIGVFLTSTLGYADVSTQILTKGEQLVFDEPTLGVNHTLILSDTILKTVDVVTTTKEAGAAPLPEKIDAYKVRLAKANDPTQTIVAELQCENPSKGYGNHVIVEHDALECSHPVHVFGMGTDILK